MDNIVSHLDITQIFSEVDDLCESFEKHWQEQPMLPSMPGERKSHSRMRLSEVMTIIIGFHGSGYKTFKEFYTMSVLPSWRKAFPNLVSYTRFVELMPWTMMLLCCFLHTRKGEVTGISFIDSTPIDVCVTCRAHAHKVFKGMVNWGKNSVGWHFGFKLHVIIESINDQLKNISQIEHSRHRSIFNFLVNLLAGLVAYSYRETKPALDLQVKGLPALPPACF